jgi:hypothetical protein
VSDPDIPAQIGPCAFGRLGAWVTVRCPHDYDALMRVCGTRAAAAGSSTHVGSAR